MASAHATPLARAHNAEAPTATAADVERPARAAYAWAAARLALGWVFLWAFLDKLFGLGFSTPPARAWLAGGSPTRGFLGNSSGPFAGFFQGIAGLPATDALFMLGLLAIGVALLLGIGLRIAAVSGGFMLLLMWAAAPPTTNPFLDDHVVYAIVLAGLAFTRAGDTWGLGRPWTATRWVQRWPWLA